MNEQTRVSLVRHIVNQHRAHSPHENILTIAFINIHHLYNISGDSVTSLWLFAGFIDLMYILLFFFPITLYHIYRISITEQNMANGIYQLLSGFSNVE